MAPIIDPEDDFLTIVAAEEQIAASDAKRRKELEDLHAKLKCMFLSFSSL
jgi:kinetochore protein Spc24